MRAYYRERAPEYDLLYAVPAYQDDLATLRGWLEPHVVGASVLEVAAGTGYWTEAAAPFARAITATDCNVETLAVAARRRLGPKVTLVEADAYALPDFGAGFEVGMAHLWWSHVEKERRPAFLSGLAARLRPNATLLMLDQRFRRGWGPHAAGVTASGTVTRCAGREARSTRWSRTTPVRNSCATAWRGFARASRSCSWTTSGPSVPASPARASESPAHP